jgi:hypothetical protein
MFSQETVIASSPSQLTSPHYLALFFIRTFGILSSHLNPGFAAFPLGACAFRVSETTGHPHSPSFTHLMALFEQDKLEPLYAVFYMHLILPPFYTHFILRIPTILIIPLMSIFPVV